MKLTTYQNRCKQQAQDYGVWIARISKLNHTLSEESVELVGEYAKKSAHLVFEVHPELREDAIAVGE